MKVKTFSLRRTVFLLSFLTSIIAESVFVLTATSAGIFSKLKGRTEISIYLKDGLSKEHIDKLLEVINDFGGVESAVYIDKKKAEEIFRKEYPDFAELLELYSECPLPEEIRIKPKNYWSSSELLKYLAEKISNLPGVEDVYYGGAWSAKVERLGTAYLRFLFFLSAIAVFFIGAVPYLYLSELASFLDGPDLQGLSSVVLLYSFLGSVAASVCVFLTIKGFGKLIPAPVTGLTLILIFVPVGSVIFHMLGLRTGVK